MVQIKKILDDLVHRRAHNKAAEQARLVSQSIDEQLRRGYTGQRKQYNVLILGRDEPFKQTFMRQFGTRAQNEEPPIISPPMYNRLANSARHTLLEIRKSLGDCSEYIGQLNTEETVSIDLDEAVIEESSESSDSDRAEEYHPTCASSADSQAYLMSQLKRINKEDILRSRGVGLTIQEGTLELGSNSLRFLLPREQNSEHQKWIHVFEEITCIIFCVDAGEYDQRIPGRPDETRLTQALAAFGTITGSPWFARTAFLLFLNNTDVLRAKLPTSPMENYYPQYAGGDNPVYAVRFILWLFMQVNRGRFSFYPYLMPDEDMAGAMRLVLAAVKETILRNALRDSGIL